MPTKKVENDLREQVRSLADVGVPHGEVMKMISNTSNMTSMAQVAAAINRLKQQYGGTSAPRMGYRR